MSNKARKKRAAQIFTASSEGKKITQWHNKEFIEIDPFSFSHCVNVIVSPEQYHIEESK